ncbi:MAG TPA: GlsB/YeaQ/YmgE family stress response membrane protein [Ktedonobacteraceae bacterium]|nr:GlsB/YeaQ/YmgE family stress response membrane protein [Ktedonobacteraceae bacterium]
MEDDGGLVMSLLAPSAAFGFWRSMLVALIGACILIAIMRAFGRRRTVA